MRKTLLLPFITLLVIACQKEQTLKPSQDSNPTHLLPNSIKTPDDVFSFLAREMPEVYTPVEISRLRTILADVPENSHQRNTGMTVELPAGSVDGLQAAVDAAGDGGTVIVKAGEHTENGLVTIGHRINLIGESGARLILDNAIIQAFPTQLTGGIHLKNGPGSRIKNIEFVASSGGAGSALFIEESDYSVIAQNSFTNFQYAIMVVSSNRTTVRKNQIFGDPALILSPENLGITIVSGHSCSVLDNYVTGMTFGIWYCDRGGIGWGNETNGNFYGQILCKVPEGGYFSADGNPFFAEQPGHRWLLALNSSNDNLYGGIVVIDGAFQNTLLANKGSGNGAYDVDLVGPTMRFGFFTPTSSRNQVWAYAGQVIKDCGENNRVMGGTLVDTSLDPCDNVEEP